MGFLPDGLEREDDARPALRVSLVKAELDGPWFRLHVNRISMEDFRAISQSLGQTPRGMRPGSSAARKLQQQWEEKYLKKVLADWDGCTLANWEAVCRDGKRFAGPKADEMRRTKACIPFSLEAAVYLSQNSWGEHFAEPILEALKTSAEDLEEEDAEKKAG